MTGVMQGIIMEYLKPFKMIVDLILRLFGIRAYREKEKVQRVIEYIDTCVHHLKVVMQFDDHNESETDYSRVFLQKAYHEVPKHLDGVATAKESDIIRKSLMGGRVYYHAARYGEVSDDQIKADYEDRFYAYVNHIYDGTDFRQNSNEPILSHLVKDGKVIPKEKREHELQQLRCVCREDIQRIESLREQLKTRRVLA